MNIEQQNTTDSSKNITHMSNPSARTKPNSLFFHTDPVKSYLETCCSWQPSQYRFVLENIINRSERQRQQISLYDYTNKQS